MTKLDQVSLCDCDFVPLLSVVNYCRASFEIVTRIRRMAPLLYIINFSKLRLRVKNETAFISAKNRVDLSSISEVRNYITEWPRFLAHPVYVYNNITISTPVAFRLDPTATEWAKSGISEHCTGDEAVTLSKGEWVYASEINWPIILSINVADVYIQNRC